MFVWLCLVSCKISSEIDPGREGLTDWKEASHGEVSPDYDVVFPSGTLHTLEISITTDDWQNIQADMLTKAGFAFGSRGNQQGGTQVPGGQNPGQGGQNPGNNGGNPGGNNGVADLINGDPIWVKSSVKFNGTEWYSVGFRLKGNSSLSSAWGQGVYKLPFRLDFDEYEDEIPAIKNQRFYGFQKLSFSPGQGDNSLMRDKVANDIFRDAGIPAAKTAFYKVYLNFGDGLKYCGVYTLVEVIDDTMIAKQFGEDQGNIYKPESAFQTFLKEAFEKKNNETANDYSDVQNVIAALNAANRTTDAASWRSSLEKVFHVDHFLKYLAINNTIVNWDTYGGMAHNYYLYTPSSTGKVTWIPWDLNLSMTSSGGMGGNSPGTGLPGTGFPGGVNPPDTTGAWNPGNGGQQPPGTNPGMGNQGGMGNNAVSLAMTEVSASWPLIRYLADDPVYYTRYKTYVKEFTATYFTPGRMHALIDNAKSLIAPAVYQETAPYSFGVSGFDQAVEDLKTHIVTRNTAVQEFLK